jgi:hypothetical protein
MRRVATIILNRNLPEPTERLYEHLIEFDGDLTDIFVLEAGSDVERISRYCTWHANTPDIMRNGLRYSRGMNYALLTVFKEKNWAQYDAFFLLTNDTELRQEKTIAQLLDVLGQHKRVGILSPCSKRWGEQLLLSDVHTKYFWFIHNHALMLRREFVESIMETLEPTFMNFVFDGSNFRGYLSESELIAKAYANDWAAAITIKAYAEENESYLLERSDLIKTELYEDNLKLYLEEGKLWMKRKYGFNSRWSMHQYVKSLYESFFEFHPEYNAFKI